jgi:hypothetical protein
VSASPGRIIPGIFYQQTKKNKMKNVLSALAGARLFIKSHPTKKDGRNDFSKYDYFTPEIVSKLVNDACIENNLICIFNLRQDQLGFYGEIITTDLESGEQLVTEMRTARPEIKATNETQQMGGMNTYAKRYALMSLFDIEDNTIDFDSQKPAENKSKESFNTSQKVWLNKGTKEFNGAIEKLKAGTTTIEKIKSVMGVSKEVEQLLKDAIKLPHGVDLEGEILNTY